jgi:4-hydroxy-3-methylbut-2-enyl diphosphate reductase
MSQPTPGFEVLLAAPRGFCAGVDRAIDIVDLALDRLEAPIYVRREIVHNRHVVDRFKERGVVFVDELSEVPSHSTVVFSAHGVAPAVWDEGRERGLRIIDATCPLVTKVHLEVQRHVDRGDTVVLIGHEGHDEVLGTMGQAPGRVVLVENEEDVHRLQVDDETKLAYVTQTTLSVDETLEIIAALKARFPLIQGPKKDDICYATQNRQEAVKHLVRLDEIDLLLVVGSANSSNSRRLVEVAQEKGVAGHLVDDAADIQESWLEGVRRVGVSAGASAPEDLVAGVLEHLAARGGRIQERRVVAEDVTFPLPAELTRAGRP